MLNFTYCFVKNLTSQEVCMQYINEKTVLFFYLTSLLTITAIYIQDIKMDKTPLQSKKFIAYLIADVGWKIALFYMLFQSKNSYNRYNFIVIITLMIVSGFIQVGYILGQAALDKYTRTIDNTIKTTNAKDANNEK